jgi:hypothetical protein
LQENNLFEAVYIAELKRTRGRLGSYFQPPPRHIMTVKHLIPLLERGNGGNRVAIRIAVCGFSKSWRENNKDYFKKHAHLVDFKFATKPDIDNFLEQHPQVDDHSTLLEANPTDCETGVQDAGEAENMEAQGLDLVVELGSINAVIGSNCVQGKHGIVFLEP